MKRLLLITLFVIMFSSLAAQAQSCTPANPYTDLSGWARWCSCMGGHIEQVGGNPSCVGANGGGGGGGNSGAYNGFYQLGYNFGRWLFSGGGSNTNAADEALRQQQQQQMMEELRRREEEAARLHQEEEAQRLAAMYNRLAGTLKLSGLPHLTLKTSGIASGGLQLKMGDNAQGYGIPGLPGIYAGGPRPGSSLPAQTGSKLQLKMGDGATGAGQASNNGQQGYGIPGLPGIYTGGPGPGAALPLPSQAGLQLKMGDAAAAPTVSSAGVPGTPDFSKMTPQQLADAADAFSKLPPEEQQRAMAGGQSGPAQPQQAPAPLANGAKAEEMKDAPASQPASQPAQAATPQTLPTQPVNSLQEQANSSQSAAASPVLEDASAKARVGFDTTSVPGPVQLGAANTPASIPPPQASPSNPSVSAAPANLAHTPPPSTPGPDYTPHKVGDSILFLFPADQPSKFFPRDPNPPLNNPLREDQKQQDELKAWDDWAIQRATHINDSHTEPGQIAYPQGTVQAELNRNAVQQYAPELLNRYNTDTAFRQSVDLRLQYTNENVALAYYHGLADAHKSAILEFHTELDQLRAAGKLDRLAPLAEQYRLHPERLKLVHPPGIALLPMATALAKAQADGNARVDKEYQFVFQLIRGQAARQY